MKRRTIKTLLVSALLIMCISIVGAGITGNAFANTNTEGFEMIGASIRYNEPTGIRFSAKVPSEVKSDVEGNENKSFGALILPYDYIDGKTIDDENPHTKVLADVQYNFAEGLEPYYNTIDEQWEVRYSITEIQYGNYNRDWFGIIYIKTMDGEIASYDYADVIDGNVIRNVAQIAEAVYDGADSDEQTILSSYIYQAEYLKANPVSDWTVEGVAEEEKALAEAYAKQQQESVMAFQSAIESDDYITAYDNYASFGTFAKELMADEKIALDVNYVTYQISSLPEAANVKASDYYAFIVVKNAYNALSSELQTQVSNSAKIADVETAFDTNFIVNTLFDGTEAGFNGGGSNTGVTKTFGVDDTYGNYIQLTNVGDSDLTTTRLYFNKSSDIDYSGYTISTSVQTSSDGRKWYYSTTTTSGYGGNSSSFTELGITSANEWKQLSWTLESDCNYINLSSPVYKNNWFRIGAIYAIKGRTDAIAGEIIQKIDALSALVDVDNLTPGDCYDIYKVWAEYDAIDDSIKSAVTNADVLEEIKTAYDAKFYVEVIFDGTEAGFDGQGSNSNVTKTFGVDDTYGNYFQMTASTSVSTARMSFNMPSDTDYTGYMIYTYAQTGADNRKWFYSTTTRDGYSSGSTNHTLLKDGVQAEEWNMLTWTLESDCEYINLASPLNTNWFRIGAIYAVKAK